MKGKIRHWNDAKGYGFIRPQNGGDDLFFHASALKNPRRRPREHEWIQYRPSTGKNGKPCAEEVVYLADLAAVDRNPFSLTPAALVSVLFLLLVPAFALVAGLHPVVALLYIIMSLLAYLFYARDKQAAVDDSWRVPENTLHLLSLAGGWPGALLAQKRLRHKTVKHSFRLVFRVTVVLNIAGFAWLLTPRGSSILNGIVDSLIRFSN